MDTKEIGNLIITQDNRITDQPMFIVQRKKIEYGYDSGYVDEYKWINSENDFHVADEEEFIRLEELDDACESTGGYEKVYYREYWDFVTACFTEQGCKDFISRDGHNLGETRIYANGSYRNYEWQTVRNMLIEQAACKAA